MSAEHLPQGEARIDEHNRKYIGHHYRWEVMPEGWNPNTSRVIVYTIGGDDEEPAREPRMTP